MSDLDLVKNALESWGRGVVEIGSSYKDGKDYKSKAREFLNKHYDFSSGEVLFKPTLASDNQFRNDLDSALSYFIGQNSNYPEDVGFALKPWQAVRFENSNTLEVNGIYLSMGNYFFTEDSAEKASEVKVEYTFGHKLGVNNELIIILHHSSLPYQN